MRHLYVFVRNSKGLNWAHTVHIAASSCDELIRIGTCDSCCHFMPSILVYFLTMIAFSGASLMLCGNTT